MVAVWPVDKTAAAAFRRRIKKHLCALMPAGAVPPYFGSFRGSRNAGRGAQSKGIPEMERDTARASLRSPSQAGRKIALALGCLLGLSVFIFTDSYWPDDGSVHEAIEWAGMALIAICVIGRTWCSFYIGSRKNKEVVHDGPYSVVRNPLYFFSIIGAFGVGAQAGGITASLVCGFLTWAVLSRMAQIEEDHMVEKFGSQYFYYMMRVPRLWPRLSLYHSRKSLEVFPAQIVTTFWDASIFFVAVPVMELFDYLHAIGTLPTRIWLP
jgi:protein-S-isoprenylcysteine O-methyltransferase Ste14